MNKTHKLILGVTALLIGGSLGLVLARGGGGHGGGHGGGFGGGGRGGSFAGRGSSFAGRGAGRTTSFAGRSSGNFASRGRASTAQPRAMTGRTSATGARQPLAGRGAAHPQAMRHGGGHGRGNHFNHRGYGHGYGRGYGRNWGWGWSWWPLGAGLGAWLIFEPYWWQYRYWDWPYGGINITVDGTRYAVADSASNADLKAVSDAADAQSTQLRSELKVVKEDYANLQDQIDTMEETAAKAQEPRLVELENKIEKIGSALKDLDTKVVGPINTKLGTYKPTGKNPETSATETTPVRERRRDRTPEKHVWSNTEIAAEGLKEANDQELGVQGILA